MQCVNRQFVARLKVRGGTVAPFPGQYPTRVLMEWVVPPAAMQTYIGKPSLTVLDRLRAGNFMLYKEFDRKSLVLMLGPEGYLNRRLFSLYHPCCVEESPNLNALGRFFYCASFGQRHRDQGFVFYHRLGSNPSALAEKVRGLLENVPGKVLGKRLAQPSLRFYRTPF